MQLALFLQLALLAGLLLLGQLASAGKKKSEEDIVLYNGNIVIRGDKKGGNIVLANQAGHGHGHGHGHEHGHHGHHEELDQGLFGGMWR